MDLVNAPMSMLKKAVVRLVGRDAANRLGAPYHDWMARRRTLRRLRGLPSSDLCVNLGCGPRSMPGWVNLDRARGPQVDIVWNLANGLPFASESCSAVFGEHVIEHLSKEDGWRLLLECRRVLQPGGVVRISTPDAGRYLRSYSGNGEFLRHPCFSETVETSMDRINIMMREGGQHLWIYDSISLDHSMRRAGFSTVLLQAFGVSLHPKMQGIDWEARAFESLYIEAVR